MQGLIKAILSGGFLLGALQSVPDRYSDQSAPPASTSEPRTVIAPATQPSVTSIEQAIAGIRDTSDPSAVIDYFTQGLAIDRNSVALTDAYVSRMVQLDLPDLAAEQSDKLLELQPNHSLARALAASSEAQDGDFPGAMTDIAIAARKLPDDKYVQSTAGRMFAWYDNTPQKPALPESITKSLDQIRHDWQDLVTFRAAYQEANDFYKKQSADAAAHQQQQQQQQAPAQAPATEPGDQSSQATQPSQQDSGYVYYPPPTYEPTRTYEPYSSVEYTEPVYDYPYYPTYYGSLYYPYHYYPYLPFYCGTSFVFFSGSHHHHHDHSHHDGDHHNWNHDGRNWSRNGTASLSSSTVRDGRSRSRGSARSPAQVRDDLQRDLRRSQATREQVQQTGPQAPTARQRTSQQRQQQQQTQRAQPARQQQPAAAQPGRSSSGTNSPDFVGPRRPAPFAPRASQSPTRSSDRSAAAAPSRSPSPSSPPTASPSGPSRSSAAPARSGGSGGGSRSGGGSGGGGGARGGGGGRR